MLGRNNPSGWLGQLKANCQSILKLIYFSKLNNYVLLAWHCHEPCHWIELTAGHRHISRLSSKHWSTKLAKTESHDSEPWLGKSWGDCLKAFKVKVKVFERVGRTLIRLTSLLAHLSNVLVFFLARGIDLPITMLQYPGIAESLLKVQGHSGFQNAKKLVAILSK